jgi:LysR family transcriptional regulator (chromosome initiation inhibitor)
MDYVAVGQADYVAQHMPQGLSAHQFAQIPFIAFNRKDDMQREFVAQAFGLRRVTLKQLFVPSSEGQVRAVLAGWGLSVLPYPLVQPLLERGELVNVVPHHRLPVALYWHCWNLQSDVLDSLSQALREGAAGALRQVASP